MLFLVFLTTAFTAVITQDLLGVSYFFDSNFYNTFSEKNCGNATHWELVSYGHLAMMPPYEASSMSILASNDSCTSSFTIAFHNGTLELSVYVRTISKYSGITAIVFDEEDNEITTVRYHRMSRHFIPGWTVISLPVTSYTMGYIQLSGQSLKEELVIIDSLRYIPDNTSIVQSLEKTNTGTNLSDQGRTRTNKSTVIKPFLFELDEIDGSGGSEEDSDDGNDGNGTEDPIDTNTTTGNPDSEEETTDNPTPEEENNEDPEETIFWNAFTITLVSVGGFVVVGTIGVGSYYLGKNRSASDNAPLDIDTLETPNVITVPRVRSIFSDAPSERFSRYS